MKSVSVLLIFTFLYFLPSTVWCNSIKDDLGHYNNLVKRGGFNPGSSSNSGNNHPHSPKMKPEGRENPIPGRPLHTNLSAYAGLRPLPQHHNHRSPSRSPKREAPKKVENTKPIGHQSHASSTSSSHPTLSPLHIPPRQKMSFDAPQRHQQRRQRSPRRFGGGGAGPSGYGNDREDVAEAIGQNAANVVLMDQGYQPFIHGVPLPVQQVGNSPIRPQSPSCFSSCPDCSDCPDFS